EAQVDRELKAARGARDADDPRRPDRAALGVDDDPCLLEPAVQQPVVGRLRTGLADDRATAETRLGMGGALAWADLAEQAEALAPDRVARLTPLRPRADG